MGKTVHVVLVITSIRDFLWFLEANLAARHFRVLAAQSPDEVESILEKEELDLIVVDLVFPYTKGIQSLRRLRQWTDTPIIAIGTETREVFRKAVLDMEAAEYLTKPFSVRDLLERVKRLLDRNLPPA